MRTLALSLLLISLPAVSTDIYRCIDDRGHTTYSQRPCGDNAEKLSVEGPRAMGSVVPDSHAIDHLETSNRIRAINRSIQDKLEEIDYLNGLMSRELDALRNQRHYNARHNLASAQWEQSLATEMQAVTQKYIIKIDLLRSDIDQLRADLDRLKTQQ